MTVLDVQKMLVQQQGIRTSAELAAELGCSPAYLSQLLSSVRRPGAKILAALGLKESLTYEVDGRGKSITPLASVKCGYHCCALIVHSGKKFCRKSHGTYEWIYRKRRELKKRAIAYLGGKCQRCGYDKCDAALHFHHKNGSDKDFQIASGSAKSWRLLVPELNKCILLCANCHAEEHEK